MAMNRSSGTLEMLLLSIVANGGPLSGYDISSILADPVPLMWSVRRSQIYPALAILEGRGDVEGSWIAQSNRPNKKAYAVTDAGIGRLRSWLLEPRATLSQDEIRLIAYNMYLVGEDFVNEALTSYRRQSVAAKRLREDRWTAGRTAPWAQHADGDRLIGIRSLYEHAFAMNDGQIHWCDEGLARAEAAVAVER